MLPDYLDLVAWTGGVLAASGKKDEEGVFYSGHLKKMLCVFLGQSIPQRRLYIPEQIIKRIESSQINQEYFFTGILDETLIFYMRQKNYKAYTKIRVCATIPERILFKFFPSSEATKSHFGGVALSHTNVSLIKTHSKLSFLRGIQKLWGIFNYVQTNKSMFYNYDKEELYVLKSQFKRTKYLIS